MILIIKNMTLYDQTKMNIHVLYKEAFPAKIGIRDGSPMVCWRHFEANWKHAWTKHEQST